MCTCIMYIMYTPSAVIFLPYVVEFYKTSIHFQRTTTGRSQPLTPSMLPELPSATPSPPSRPSVRAAAAPAWTGSTVSPPLPPGMRAPLGAAATSPRKPTAVPRHRAWPKDDEWEEWSPLVDGTAMRPSTASAVIVGGATPPDAAARADAATAPPSPPAARARPLSPRDKYLKRLSTPLAVPRLSTTPPVAGVALQSRQRQSFAELHARCQRLEQANAGLARHTEDLEHELRLLRRGEVYPQAVVGQLESHNAELERTHAGLQHANRALDEERVRLSREAIQLETRTQPPPPPALDPAAPWVAEPLSWPWLPTHALCHGGSPTHALCHGGSPTRTPCAMVALPHARTALHPTGRPHALRTLALSHPRRARRARLRAGDGTRAVRGARAARGGDEP